MVWVNTPYHIFSFWFFKKDMNMKTNNKLMHMDGLETIKNYKAIGSLESFCQNDEVLIYSIIEAFTPNEPLTFRRFMDNVQEKDILDFLIDVKESSIIIDGKSIEDTFSRYSRNHRDCLISSIESNDIPEEKEENIKLLQLYDELIEKTQSKAKVVDSLQKVGITSKGEVTSKSEFPIFTADAVLRTLTPGKWDLNENIVEMNESRKVPTYSNMDGVEILEKCHVAGIARYSMDTGKIKALLPHSNTMSVQKAVEKEYNTRMRNIRDIVMPKFREKCVERGISLPSNAINIWMHLAEELAIANAPKDIFTPDFQKNLDNVYNDFKSIQIGTRLNNELQVSRLQSSILDQFTSAYGPIARTEQLGDMVKNVIEGGSVSGFGPTLLEYASRRHIKPSSIIKRKCANISEAAHVIHDTSMLHLVSELGICDKNVILANFGKHVGIKKPDCSPAYFRGLMNRRKTKFVDGMYTGSTEGKTYDHKTLEQLLRFPVAEEIYTKTSNEVPFEEGMGDIKYLFANYASCLGTKTETPIFSIEESKNILKRLKKSEIDGISNTIPLRRDKKGIVLCNKKNLEVMHLSSEQGLKKIESDVWSYLSKRHIQLAKSV